MFKELSLPHRDAAFQQEGSNLIDNARALADQPLHGTAIIEANDWNEFLPISMPIIVRNPQTAYRKRPTFSAFRTSGSLTGF